MAPFVNVQAVCGQCRGYGGVALVRIALLFNDNNPPYSCVGVGTWVKDVIKKQRLSIAKSVPISCFRRELRRAT